jgi:hypothetical protein
VVDGLVETGPQLVGSERVELTLEHEMSCRWVERESRKKSMVAS